MWVEYNGMNQAITGMYNLNPSVEVPGLRAAFDSIDSTALYNTAVSDIAASLRFEVWDKASAVTTASGVVWAAQDLMDHFEAKSMYASPGEIIFCLNNNDEVVEVVGYDPDISGLTPLQPSQTAELIQRKTDSAVISRATDLFLEELVGLLGL